MLDAGELLHLVRLQTLSGPALCQPVRGENVNLLRDLALAVLAGDEGGLLLVHSGKVEKVPVGVKGVELIVCLAHFCAGEQHQKRALLHLGVKPCPVALKKFLGHGSSCSAAPENELAQAFLWFPLCTIVFHARAKCKGVIGQAAAAQQKTLQSQGKLSRRWADGGAILHNFRMNQRQAAVFLFPERVLLIVEQAVKAPLGKTWHSVIKAVDQKVLILKHVHIHKGHRRKFLLVRGLERLSAVFWHARRLP